MYLPIKKPTGTPTTAASAKPAKISNIVEPRPERKRGCKVGEQLHKHVCGLERRSKPKRVVNNICKKLPYCDEKYDRSNEDGKPKLMDCAQRFKPLESLSLSFHLNKRRSKSLGV